MVDYELLSAQIRETILEERWYVPALSNVSALLMETLPDLNWVGFYVQREGRLVLGPFQGKPACIHIAFGKGVCGTAFLEDRTQNVPDVHAFPGHIACDSASNSELVIPLHFEGKPVAVMDLDSPLFARFTAEDEAGLRKIAGLMEQLLSWKS